MSQYEVDPPDCTCLHERWDCSDYVSDGVRYTEWENYNNQCPYYYKCCAPPQKYWLVFPENYHMP